MAQEADPKVRHEFVGMMFAVAIGEVGIQTAALVHYEHYVGFLPVYLHLLLATIIIASSWVGWTLTPTKEAQKDLTGVLRIQFLVLLLDVFLVILYFILARAMNTTAGDTDSPHYTFAADADAGWLVGIFVCYLLWDLLTKLPDLVCPKRKQAEADRVAAKKRIKISVVCLILSILVWLLVAKADALHVCWAELALISLVLLFRALKEFASAKWPPSNATHEELAAAKKHKPWAKGWSWLLFVSLGIFTLCARYVPLPATVTVEIQSAQSLFGPVNPAAK
jgi:hypothetical protein